MLFLTETTPITEVPLSPKPIYQGSWSPRLPVYHKPQRSPIKTAAIACSALAGVLLLSCGLMPPTSFTSVETSALGGDAYGRVAALFRTPSSPPACPSAPPPSPSPSLAALAPILDSSATASCDTCIIDPTNPLCEYGIDNTRLSRVFDGSGARVRKFLQQCMRGEECSIGIIGASVTAGHGLNGKQKWQDRFFIDFKMIFPQAEIHDGSAPGMNSAFYGYCFDSLLPRTMGLYLLELDVNNEMIDDTFVYDDTLYRGLLSLPQKPAVVRVSVFALAFEDMARGLVSNLLMSNFFDVPIVSIRNFLLPHLIANPDEVPKFFSEDYAGDADLRHISYLSHRALGDMLALYMREMTCETKRRLVHPPPALPSNLPWPTGKNLGEIPRLYIWDTYSPTFEAPPVIPSCSFLASPLTGKSLIPLGDEDEWSKSWKRVDWNGKAAWQSSDIGAQISFSFVGGKVGVFVWSTNGAGNILNPGRARCWVGDDVEKGKVVDAFGDGFASSSGFNLVAEGLKHAEHTLTCQILAESSTDGHDFRILGVASQ